MISKIKKYFRKKINKQHQEKLIEKLHKEHEELFKIVNKIDIAVIKKKKKNILKLLSKFKNLLELHLLYEETNLYEHLYLRYSFFTEIKEKIIEKHNEIKKITEVVTNFLIKYKDDIESIEQFKEDFSQIKEVLIKRVTFEEEVLYDVYHNRFHKLATILEKFTNYQNTI